MVQTVDLEAPTSPPLEFHTQLVVVSRVKPVDALWTGPSSHLD